MKHVFPLNTNLPDVTILLTSSGIAIAIGYAREYDNDWPVTGVNLCCTFRSILEFNMASSKSSISASNVDRLNTLLNFFKLVLKNVCIVSNTKFSVALGVALVRFGSKLKNTSNSKNAVTGSVNSVDIDMIAKLSVSSVTIRFLTSA